MRTLIAIACISLTITAHGQESAVTGNLQAITTQTFTANLNNTSTTLSTMYNDIEQKLAAIATCGQLGKFYPCSTTTSPTGN